ncbi:hypothetical protein [Weissella viridescens]|uniref:hypothetical protein n=1 Tax=Weissella viridescens TaxID=1629 RepID=UPI003AF28969
MKLTIEGTEEEIKNTLQAIGGSKERDSEYTGLVDVTTGEPITRSKIRNGVAKSSGIDN